MDKTAKSSMTKDIQDKLGGAVSRVIDVRDRLHFMTDAVSHLLAHPEEQEDASIDGMTGIFLDMEHETEAICRLILSGRKELDLLMRKEGEDKKRKKMA